MTNGQRVPDSKIYREQPPVKPLHHFPTLTLQEGPQNDAGANVHMPWTFARHYANGLPKTESNAVFHVFKAHTANLNTSVALDGKCI